jgi:hypothetical protein
MPTGKEPEDREIAPDRSPVYSFSIGTPSFPLPRRTRMTRPVSPLPRGEKTAVLLLSVFLVSACSKSKDWSDGSTPGPPSTPPPAATTPPPSAGSALPAPNAPSGAIVLRTGGNSETLSVEPDGAAFRVRGGAGRDAGKIVFQADRAELLDPAGALVGRIKQKENGLEIESPSGERRFRIKKDDDGDWKLKDPSGKTLLKMKVKTNGWEVRDDAGKTIAKAKGHGSGATLETEEGMKLFDTPGLSDPKGAMWLVAPMLGDLEKAGLALWFRDRVR